MKSKSPPKPTSASTSALSIQNPIDRLLSAFMSGMNENTRLGYSQDLESFRQFLETKSTREAVKHLLAQSHGDANYLALQFKDYLMKQGLKANSVNRRLTALRSVVRLARTLGIVSFTLEVKNLKTRAYSNVRGPGRSVVFQVLEYLEDGQTPKAIRDKAIILLLAVLGTRASETTNIDLEDLNLTEKTVAVKGKGRNEKETLSLPDLVVEALKRWIEVRGNHKGALFHNFDRAKKGDGRLTRFGLYKVVVALAKKVGAQVKANPHRYRHHALSEAVKASRANNITLKEALSFSRHADISTLAIYEDVERNVQGILADLVASVLKNGGSK